MRGLMKTTSRSESLNSFFKSFSHHGNNLLKFVLSHDIAMDKQRNRQRTDEHQSITTTPDFKTNSSIERHAASVYSRIVFFDVQDEIVKAEKYCSQWNVIDDGGSQIFTIRQKDKTNKTKSEFKVVLFEADRSLNCSCQKYEYFGILCCHIFRVLFNLDAEEIPGKYVNRRWTRGVIPMDVLRTRRIQIGSNEKSDKLTNDILFEVDQIFGRIYGDEEKLELVLQKVRQIKSDISPDVPLVDSVTSKDAEFEKLLGVSKPKTIDVRAPSGIRNKGSRTGKRLISGAERAMKKRKCRACNKVTDHDARNCTMKKPKSK